MEFTFTLDDIKATAANVWQVHQHQKVWALHGEMGAGKTTFVHALCEVLGVTTAIGSPTYSIINEYASSKAGTIYHMDLYRLRDEEEAMQAGIEDAIYSGNLCLVEWPEKAAMLLPDDCLHLTIQLIDAQTRMISSAKH
ncbi:tRNA (adenosine(37)-N6)-threonylcarbamoyltransferase complex ATPase subunit type 1 TsaE [Aridibaculum aurantiacum]|uniref:tRNA (adenosine(37)-N6)-threonylcarbamoyltransferase complex ATPase subunit type 1 TsaE n=1 Tax=Aridibaculum aurantiacum TaxID=2810307 RepID=UPI001A97C90F|nr:tRNA (adenosine(37)-N6)-threonylcarbamoyltransferase complex ATPase subunit type 1 TsaE [Aridibaculum aurantiacum]